MPEPVEPSEEAVKAVTDALVAAAAPGALTLCLAAVVRMTLDVALPIERERWEAETGQWRKVADQLAESLRVRVERGKHRFVPHPALAAYRRARGDEGRLADAAPVPITPAPAPEEPPEPGVRTLALLESDE